MEGFLMKNRDALNPDVAAAVAASTNLLVATLFRTAPATPASSGSGGADGKLTMRTMRKANHQSSVASQFQVRHGACTKRGRERERCMQAVGVRHKRLSEASLFEVRHTALSLAVAMGARERDAHVACHTRQGTSRVYG